MASVTITQRIAAAPERVFALATDFAHAPERIRGIERMEVLTPGPVGVGTRVRETRRMLGKEHTEELEVTAFDPPRSYRVGCVSHGTRYDSELRFEPVEGGTEVAMHFEAVPLTLGARLLSFLARPMLKSVAKECGRDLEDLRVALESPGA